MTVLNTQTTTTPRPVGRALIVGMPSVRLQPMDVLQKLGFACAELDDPYAAMAELCRRPMVYRALVLSLAGMFREELQLIGAVKRRLPHIDIWMTHADGRLNLLADSMRLGADGMLSEDGLHRTEPAQAEASATSLLTQAPQTKTSPPAPVPQTDAPTVEARSRVPVEAELEPSPGEPVLTADELRALLQEQPFSLPPSQGDAP
jgi:hypothetical protein